MKHLLTELRVAVMTTVALVVLCCGLYPAVIWGLSQVIFPDQANGSLIKQKGTLVGSRLIGQGFSGEAYFHPRPSAAGTGYDPVHSGGSNLGPLSRNLIETVGKRIKAYRHENRLGDTALVPVDAVTASGSGLDPHISVVNARLQAARVADARGMKEESIQKLIANHTECRDFWLFGEPRVNVLTLNLDLDAGEGK